ncbi:MAG: sigma 54-interacting transcriptional regulator, partial [Candidatus Krumholzibacteria bacterium]|nr:sigma 54-interacting transcriptional regulator [Candidatus Krumholzibacteria bacterium]
MGDVQKALEILDEAIHQAWPDDQYYNLRYCLGKARFWKGDYAVADQSLQECHSFYAKNSNYTMLGNIQYMLGYMAFQRSFLDIAECYYRKALESFGIDGKHFKLGTTHRMLAILAYRRGQYAEARNRLSVAKDCFLGCSDRKATTACRIAEARVSLFEGDYEVARTALSGTLRLAERSGYKREAALSSEFLGEACYHLAKYELALRYLSRAEKLALQLAPSGDIAVEVYRRLGDVYIAMGRLNDAEAALAKALPVAQHLQDRYELGSILRALGLLASRRGDLDLARSYFKEAIAVLVVMKERFELACTYIAAALEYGCWSASDRTPSELGQSLLNEARSYSIEAMHLFSSLGIESKVEECREFIRRLKQESPRAMESPSCHQVNFNKKWLIGNILVARSAHLLNVVSRVRQLAPTAIPVVVTGETGTGKELVARLLHMFSDRAGDPFVAVNCASVPEAVFESELFGHKKGSFTGAVVDKAGLMELASGGTLFLDEISELSNRQQAKLLRALQDGAIRRVGETRMHAIDVRVVSASNEDMKDMMKAGRLRTDFYYRIAGETIQLEPLRRRLDDMVALFAYYVGKASPDFRIEDEVLKLLAEYPWPGNVRELINVTNALVLAGAQSKTIHVRDLPILIGDFAKSEADLSSRCNRLSERRRNNSSDRDREQDDASRALVRSLLDRCRGNRSAVAR